jgi:hypothetical protein
VFGSVQQLSPEGHWEGAAPAVGAHIGGLQMPPSLQDTAHCVPLCQPPASQNCGWSTVVH